MNDTSNSTKNGAGEPDPFTEGEPLAEEERDAQAADQHNWNWVSGSSTLHHVAEADAVPDLGPGNTTPANVEGNIRDRHPHGGPKLPAVETGTWGEATGATELGAEGLGK